MLRRHLSDARTTRIDPVAHSAMISPNRALTDVRQCLSLTWEVCHEGSTVPAFERSAHRHEPRGNNSLSVAIKRNKDHQ